MLLKWISLRLGRMVARSALLKRHWSFVHSFIRNVYRFFTLIIPYTLFWLPVTLRFFLLVLEEAIYNLYLFFFNLPADYERVLERVIAESTGGVAIVTGGTSGIGKEI